MSEMPSKVRVLGRAVSIVFDEKGDQLTDEEEGWCQTQLLSVIVKKSLADTELRATVLHELFHDIDHLMGTGLKEPAIASLASGLFAVMRDNPDLVTWLME
jgi:hypothetical protein